MEQPSSESILVIGADLHFCYLMRRYVRESAHPLLFSIPDDQAVDLALREKPALIVLEAGIPSTKGRQILKNLKENMQTCQIPVALCTWQETGTHEPTDGADIYLQMPILYGDFIEMLTRLGISASESKHEEP